MEIEQVNLLRWGGILLLAGGILFWAGAFTPPYKQWSTSETKTYLTIIAEHKLNWWIIHILFVLGILFSLFGMYVFCNGLTGQNGNKILLSVIPVAYFMGTVLWLLNIAFRLTVTVWAAERLKNTNELDPAFQTWMDWSNFIFSIYMVLSYLCIGLLGVVLKDVSLLPVWVNWMMIVFGFGGMIGYAVRFIFFDPPLMVHLPLIILGIMILVKIKSE